MRGERNKEFFTQRLQSTPNGNQPLLSKRLFEVSTKFFLKLFKSVVLGIGLKLHQMSDERCAADFNQKTAFLTSQAYCFALNSSC